MQLDALTLFADGEGSELEGFSLTDRLNLARARRAEDALARERAFLVSVAQMRRLVAQIVPVIEQQLAELPGTLSRRYNLPEPVRTELDRMVGQALLTMRDGLGDLAP